MRCYSVQCMDNVHFDNLYNNTSNSSSATVVPQFVKSDPSLFKDDVDIRFHNIDYYSLNQFHVTNRICNVQLFRLLL